MSGNAPIEPVLRDAALAREIEETAFDGPGVAIWWLGQSGFALKSQEAVVYIDPCLSEHLTKKYAGKPNEHIRITSSPMRGEHVDHAALVVSTHKHSDHMDPGTIPEILAASPGAKYLIPRAHRDHVLSWGIDEERLILADVDQPISCAGIRIIPQPAAHESFEYIDGTGYPHMGFILQMGGMNVYHSGDTIPYHGLAQRVQRHEVDIALLPINGRDAARHDKGMQGNLSMEEALCLAAVCGVKHLVPHHYDMFTLNTVDITEFRALARENYANQSVCIMQCGEKHVFEP